MSFAGIHDMNEETIYFDFRRTRENDETFHSHRGTEILWIHQGYGTMIVNNVSYEIKPGMICIFQPFQLHHLRLDYKNHQLFERSLAIFEPTMYERYFDSWPMLRTFYQYINYAVLSTPCIYGIEQHDELENLFLHLQQKLKSTSSEVELLEEISLFIMLLFRLLKPLWPQQQEQLTPFRTRKQKQVERMLQWIEHNYMEPFDLEKMSKDLHVSTYHLSHSFKEMVGISITEYIATRRIHQAVRLLTTTDQPVSYIAEQVGITNTSYFCKFFKDRMGTTPHQYRKRWIQ